MKIDKMNEDMKKYAMDFKNVNLKECGKIVNIIKDISQKQKGIFCVSDIKKQTSISERQINRIITRFQRYNCFPVIEKEEAKRILKEVNRIRKIKLGQSIYRRYNSNNKIVKLFEPIKQGKVELKKADF